MITFEEVIKQGLIFYCVRCKKNLVLRSEGQFCGECEEKNHKEALDSAYDNYGSSSNT